MEEAKIAQKEPYAVNVEKGKTYYWCACGRSASQPFCDGSHQGTSFSPVAYTAEKNETVHFCGCKHTKNPPFCDGIIIISKTITMTNIRKGAAVKASPFSYI